MDASVKKKPALTTAQMNWLRRLSGELIHSKLLRPQAKRQVIASLIDRGLIKPDGWKPTEAGYAILRSRKEQV